MSKNKLNQSAKIALIAPIGKIKIKKMDYDSIGSQEERTSNEKFKDFLHRIQLTLSIRVDDKRCYVVSIPFQSRDVQTAIVEETLEITENLMKRLQAKVNKKRAYLANPIGDNEVARPLFVDELTLEQRSKSLVDFNFSENDVLYISGHANFVIFGGLTPHELAKQYYDFLKNTGIKEVKLSGCHTGSRFYERDLPPLKYAPEDLLQSYAMKFSQELLDLGLGDITVYGYRGSLSDQREKSKFAKVAFHSYVEMYSFFHGKAKVEEVRGHEASVCFKDGVLLKKPIIAEDSLFEDSGVNYSLTY